VRDLVELMGTVAVELHKIEVLPRAVRDLAELMGAVVG
jgi:hypothetical protein